MTMASYRKKAIDVEAFQLGKDAFPDWFNSAIGDGTVSIYTRTGSEARRIFCTIKGHKRADCGDYVILGQRGEIYACESEEFAQCYEPVHRKGETL